MEIKDIQANQGGVDIVAEVVEKEEPRSFEKFGKTGQVCSAKLKDGSGEVKMTLWNEDIEKVKVGDKIHLEKGWCSEYQGEKQVSAGKFGKIEVVENPTPSDDKTVYTNDPSLLAGQGLGGEMETPEETPPEENSDVVEEEVVE